MMQRRGIARKTEERHHGGSRVEAMQRKQGRSMQIETEERHHKEDR
jgi:hypothetical protein